MTALPEELAGAVQRLVAGSTRPVVLIDGGAGSGKTTLGRSLAENWPDELGVQVISLDDTYQGWGGMAAASAAVPELITGPGYRRWDWERDQPDGWCSLETSLALIVEGCGAITPGSRPLAGLAIWLELDEPHRRRRALERDGATFAAHWDEWAAQEYAHWQADRPWTLADLIIAGDNT